jgi:NADH-quinone oxidoreductase subunit C
MNPTALEKMLDKIKEAFSSSIQDISNPYDLLTIQVESSKILEILRFLKLEVDMGFSYLTDICGIHYPDQKGAELGVIYHLHNLNANIRIRIKTFVGLDRPYLDSSVGLFPGANWMERETYDFYGIIFEGHPDLRRILNVDDMVAFPLRKEFPLEDPNRRDKQDEFFGR